MFRLALVFILMCAWSPAIAQECGPETPCETENGSYHLKLPDGEGPYPVLIWYHGFRGNGASIHRSAGLQKDFLEHGYALLAPNGIKRPRDGARAYPARDGAPRDDVKFTFDVLKAAGKRANLDLGKVFAGGFSAGGSMAWLLACEEGAQLAGMVSVAGALRRPNSTDCAGLKDLPVMHVHGFADKQVPLEGRQIRDWHQGSVWETLEKARQVKGCRSNPDDIEIGEAFSHRLWQASCAGAPVRMYLHDGGHGLPQGWTERARRFFEQSTKTD
ncbi:MAG: dienelactone hydrolase family protein [Pseudomonadota bacterium]